MFEKHARTPIAAARGLGSARNGVQAWWLERLSAVALLPLTLWLTASLIALSGGDHAAVIGWLRSPLSALLITLLLTTLFIHLAFGLAVVIEDYVHSGAKIPLLVAARFACIALCLAGIFATLSVYFGG